MNRPSRAGEPAGRIALNTCKFALSMARSQSKRMKSRALTWRARSALKSMPRRSAARWLLASGGEPR